MQFLEILLGLVGGGTLLQFVATLLTLRQNRRQLNATALGSEVEALEKSISVIFANFEKMNAVYERETERLGHRISELERANEALRQKLQAAMGELRRLRRRG